MLDSLGISRSDCVEKSDLLSRLEEYRKNKKKTTSNETENIPPFHLGNPSLLAIKIISVGAQEVGKSCLIKRYCEGRFVKRFRLI